MSRIKPETAARILSPVLFPAKPAIVNRIQQALPGATDAVSTFSSAPKKTVTGNGFRSSLVGPNPPESAGSVAEQAYQLVVSGNLLAFSLIHATPLPNLSRKEIDGVLSAMNRIPILPNSPVTHADYTSEIPNVTPDKAFAYLKANLRNLFSAGGLTLHPAPRVETGERMFIGDSWSTPWLPVELEVDTENLRVRANTLDGHAFRGWNEWQIVPNDEGGVRLEQRSEFQASSEAAEKGYALQNAHARQERTWKAFHQKAFDDLKNG